MNISACLSLSVFNCHLTIGNPENGEANIIIGPLQVWLGWRMQGAVWRDRWDFVMEPTHYRPESGAWYEAGHEEEPGIVAGYFFGRRWCLVTEAQLKATAVVGC